MLDILSFTIFVGVFGGITFIRYLINRCDKVDNETRLLILNENQTINNIEIPPKYEELSPQYES